MRTIHLSLIAGACVVVLAAGCSTKNSGSGTSSAGGAAGGKINIYLLPKKKGVAYFTSCDNGAEQAAKDLGDVNLVYDGPTDGSPEASASLIDTWTLKGANVIAVSPNDPDVLAPSMKKAQTEGVKVLTWDADGAKDARSFFVDQATSEEIGNALVDR